jgi:hypothetical protein
LVSVSEPTILRWLASEYRVLRLSREGRMLENAPKWLVNFVEAGRLGLIMMAIVLTVFLLYVLLYGFVELNKERLPPAFLRSVLASPGGLLVLIYSGWGLVFLGVVIRLIYRMIIDQLYDELMWPIVFCLSIGALFSYLAIRKLREVLEILKH